MILVYYERLQKITSDYGFSRTSGYSQASENSESFLEYFGIVRKFSEDFKRDSRLDFFFGLDNKEDTRFFL